MFFRSRSQRYRSAKFFRNYFILGILGISIIFFSYFYWLKWQWERETSDFSRMVAAFVGRLPSVADKEASDIGKEIIDILNFPFILTELDGEPIVSRGIGDGLREKIFANTLTPEERQRIKKITADMDRIYEPIRVIVIKEADGKQEKVERYWDIYIMIRRNIR